jgi:hypothetical protein
VKMSATSYNKQSNPAMSRRMNLPLTLAWVLRMGVAAANVVSNEDDSDFPRVYIVAGTADC